MRRVLMASRHLVSKTTDWLLWSLRARLAKRDLGRGAPAQVLVLCHGNIIRSPYAAARLQEQSARRGLGLEVGSAGFIGPGRSCPEFAISIAREHGLDLMGHESKLLDRETLSAAALVLVMNAEQKRALPRSTRVVVLGDLDPVRGMPRAIPDPWGKPIEVCRESYERIDRCLSVLVEVLARA